MTLIAALSRNAVIGRDNALPWRLPEDLRRFRALTLGKPVLMGRRTFESIGRALPGRDNLVLTRDAAFAARDCRVCTRLHDALCAAGDAELMVIGGAEVYAQTMALATRMHLTEVDAQVPGDTFFPHFEPREWEVIGEQQFAAGPERALGFRFVDYVRRASVASRAR